MIKKNIFKMLTKIYIYLYILTKIKNLFELKKIYI